MTTGIYVRWQIDTDRLVTVVPPLSIDHPLAGQPCLVCGNNLFGGNGTIPPPERDVALLVLGVEPDGAEKDAAGRWGNAVALVLHATCADPRHVEGSAGPREDAV